MSRSGPVTGVLRLTRAAGLTLATVSLALVAHVVAGGAAPGPVGLLLVTAPVLALSLVATGRRLGRPAVGAVLAVTQVALHTAFMALGAGGGAAVALGGGHHEHLLLTPGAGPSSGLLGSWTLGPSSAMTAGHVVAAGLLALLLARGEAALWAVWSWLRPALPDAPRLRGPVDVPTSGRCPASRSGEPAGGPRPRGPPPGSLPIAPAGRLAAPA